MIGYIGYLVGIGILLMHLAFFIDRDIGFRPPVIGIYAQDFTRAICSDLGLCGVGSLLSGIGPLLSIRTVLMHLATVLQKPRKDCFQKGRQGRRRKTELGMDLAGKETLG